MIPQINCCNKLKSFILIYSFLNLSCLVFVSWPHTNLPHDNKYAIRMMLQQTATTVGTYFCLFEVNHSNLLHKKTETLLTSLATVSPLVPVALDYSHKWRVYKADIKVVLTVVYGYMNPLRICRCRC